MKITDKISKLISPTITDMGYELVGVEYIGGKPNILRVFIDSKAGIKVKDCENVSHQLGAIFDATDPISNRYNLEVSSPGVERPLFCIQHYQRFLGYDIQVLLYRAIKGQRKFRGSIAKVSALHNSIELMGEIDSVTLDIEMIDKANLVANF